MADVTRTTKLSTLKAARRSRAGTEAVPARMVRSIRQSLRVEGYDVPERIIREAAERVLRMDRTRK